MHVQIEIVRAIVALELHGGVARHRRDRPVDNGNGLPEIVFVGGRANVLP